MAKLGLRIDGTRFRDHYGREVTLRGINVAGDSKYPRKPDLPTHKSTDFWDGDNVSFVGRPFSELDAHTHFARLKRWGYNTIRYVFTWEAIEHAGPGQYDEDFVAHTVKMLRIAKSYGFYVFMDPHQDIWSRHSGGDGAPMWTLYAAGFDPQKFASTQAALVHNSWPDPADFPKMLWPTNYGRLVCLTMFALFWAGRDFAPNAQINGQHIQDYLFDHFVGACTHLAKRIHEAGDLEDVCVIGWETMNEPNRGILGWQDLDAIPAELKMKKGSCPTPWQSFLTGSGRAVEVETFEFGSFGPYKSGTELIDPEGSSAWLQDTTYDEKYGWKRSAEWKLGTCLWAQQGIWDPETDKLLKNDYFARLPNGKKLDYEVFTNTYFIDHVRKYKQALRTVHNGCMLLLQAPVLELPPSITGTADDDDRMIFASHYYDGLTLLTKHWNRVYNVDVFGVLRGRYWSPAFAVKFGETAIRNCLRDQLIAIRDEGLKYTGTRPVLFTEIGIPYDMDDKHAYKTGDYSSQIAALDANHFALEGSGVAGYTLWLYCASNNHLWSDNWNGEDLSIFSVDDTLPPPPPSQSGLLSANASQISVATSKSSTVGPDNLGSMVKSPPQLQIRPTATPPDLAVPGLRAAEAFLRPSPIKTHGDVVKYGFNLRQATFNFTLNALSKTPDDAPTEMFLPDFHFPPGGFHVEVSGGKWMAEIVEVDGEGMQWMKWWHAAGEQNMKVTGTVRKSGAEASGSTDEEYGYYEAVKSIGENCEVM